MLDVSVQPSHLTVGVPTRMALRFVNSERGACTHIVFRLDLPFGLTLTDGQAKVEIPSIAAGGTHVHEFTVRPTKAGDFTLASGNFSYRDPYGVSEYPDDFQWDLHVTPGAAPLPTSPRPAPWLAVWFEDAPAAFPVGTWRELKILVRNPSDITLGDVMLDLSGPLLVNSAPQRAQIHTGTTVRFTFSVRADEGGRVPVGVRTTFTYPDGVGSIRRAAQDDTLPLEVTERAVPPVPPPPSEPARIILFMSASPDVSNLFPPECQDGQESTWLPLRTDHEVRDVEERLDLSRHRDQYLIKEQSAARWKDIERRLAQYRPQVVHFSGHGDKEGNLLVEKEGGGAELVRPEGVTRLFSVYHSSIELVFVNACYSEHLARAVFKSINNVIGMRWQVGDAAAVAFSTGFYTAYFNGVAIPDAFNAGLAAIERSEATMHETRIPLLLTRD
jgi:CHAT domain